MQTYQQAPLGGLNVLVVEDETLLSIDLEIMLEEMGCQVVGVAPHREGAVRLIDLLGDHIDCVLLDTKLATRSSQAVADKLKKAQIPFVLMSDGTELHCQAYNAPSIAKPLRPGQIRRALQAVAGRPIHRSIRIPDRCLAAMA